ncbi:hypothetical protein CHH55_23250 [Niallia circulans]|uniref:DEAD/DEAH box helicase n=1 Tax=Niallia circulans TaxID=1397 RepID=UPI000BA602B8|nr:DEAD/DEAH box helicase family protein [Niallia circulans]PAD85454.1 hypothetical protein CHH55_23250 [Niallia circulans]
MSIFKQKKEIIKGNQNLHSAQIEAYNAAIAHYKEFPDPLHRESLIVMPTGSGKTGLMSILPFGLSNGRVLIITPGKIVRKTVFNEFDSIQNPQKTFWYKQKVILDRKYFPKSYLYKGFNPNINGEKELALKKLTMSDIVITNIHKVVASNESVNLRDLVPENFFDLIIIDEAHHAAADMWQQTLKHFKESKVIKLTATPFRSDRAEISTHPYDPIFEYTLGEAIIDGLVKDVVKGEEIPGELEFIDSKSGKKYKLEEAKKLLGNDWVNKTIAMSESCSKQVIQNTKKILEMKRNSYANHQVLAIACNEEHAIDVTKWFNDLGLSCSYVSSNLSDKEIEVRLNDFANGKYDVMVSIQMLGEGYDNPNISVISIFRPFKTLSPYAQAIGRGLRKIRNSNTNSIDNYCDVVYHQELGLEKLWGYYKNQEEYGKTIKQQLSTLSEQLSFAFDELGFVEKVPNYNKGNNSSDMEFDTIVNFGRVSQYKSGGLGKQDSFSADGYDKYLEAQLQLISDLQQKNQTEIDHIIEMKENGLLNEIQAKTLIDQIENNSQLEYDNSLEDFHDLLLAESLRKDFLNWLNLKIEDFFKVSLLDKEGFELYDHEDIIIRQPINNIGYVVKNFYHSLYNKSKKEISLYTPIDFAAAKQHFIEKIEYYAHQYGTKEEDELQ